jgi:hypothetical protein
MPSTVQEKKTHHLVEGKKALNTFVAKENAYSATTVFPADVWAAKKTDSPFSR